MINLVWLVPALFLVVKSADYAIRYAARLALAFRLSKYTVGFTIVAAISALPETMVAVSSSFQGVPSFGLGTLFGSNVADLTFVFAMVVLIAGRDLKIQSEILKNRLYYTGILAAPIILGLDGYFSRVEGLGLIAVGLLFYFFVLQKNQRSKKADQVKYKFSFPALFLLILSLLGLLLGAYFTVKFAVATANWLRVSPVLIALLIGLGSCLPELSFSIKAAKKNHGHLALGDILGTVITDATIVVGILALIRPFGFEQKIIYITGLFMFLAIILLLYLMKTDKVLTKAESLILLFFYLLFVLTEFMAGSNAYGFLTNQ